MRNKKRADIWLTASVILAATATAVIFTVLFITGDSGLISKVAAPKSDIAQSSPDTVAEPEENLTTTDAMQKQIDSYKKYLSSDYMVTVDNSVTYTKTPSDLVKLTDFPEISLRSEAAAQLQAFTEQAEKDGITFTVFRGYTSAEEQQDYYDAEYERNVAAGYVNEEMATQKTLLAEALPGHSEHQTGYAVDIAETESTEVSTVKNSKFYEYAMQNIAKYGFILSYPEEKTAVTKRSFQPWHFRYIGDAEQARFITENGMCLEEYRAYIKQQIKSLQTKIEEENSKKLK